MGWENGYLNTLLCLLQCVWDAWHYTLRSWHLCLPDPSCDLLLFPLFISNISIFPVAQARNLGSIIVDFAPSFISYNCCCLVAKLCPTLLWPHGLYSLPGSSVHGIFQARILEWIAISFSRESSLPRNWPRVSCIAGRFFTDWAMREEEVNPRGCCYC